MTKAMLLAIAGAVSLASLAHAQPSGGGASTGAGAGASSPTTSGSGSTGITGGGSVAVPPGGVSGGASTTVPSQQPSQPSIDINQAQQPGIGANSGASGNGGVRPLGR